MRTALIALPFVLSLAACAAEGPTDELAGETAEDLAGDGKADASVDGTYTYFAIRGDTRRCASPMCGGYFVERLNRSTTVCHNGVQAENCYAAELDWSEANLSEQARYQLTGAAAEGAIGEGVKAIVRGRLGTLGTPRKGEPSYGRFIVTEAWTAESATPSEGVFVRVKDGGVRCIAAPCESLIEKGLNQSRTAHIAGIDFEPAQLDEARLAAVSNDMFAAGGVIIAGERFTITEEGRTARGRTATAVFRRVVDRAADGCFVGGCSGQVCSDQEGVISTCEWREEYACYQEAACERQTDGQCGWTDTPALQACLGTN